ncbi:tail fiber assembly protein [Yersinia pseudotuberculosis]|uniref:tail fiber assembly protein n=1 Tax=Yersinia pseudotuberculosis TaxID=633 RepID=UPI0038B4E6BF
MIYYSAKTRGFYVETMKIDGSYADCWPSDAVLLTNEEVKQYWQQSPPPGRELGSVGVRPAWVDLPALTAEEITAQKAEFVTQAKLKKSKLISDASDRIEILKDRIEAGQDKAAELKLWKAYRIALDDIDVSAAPDIEWPVSPDDIKLPVVLTKAKLGN